MTLNAKSPYAVQVFDLMHRPGEMREKLLDVVVPEAFGNAVIGIAEGAHLELDVRLESLHDGILVSVAIDGTATGECVRCLTSVAEPVEVDMQELFAYSQDEAFDYEVQDEVIDLEPVVRDAVVLSLPFQPVCQEDCPGLCPQCGVRLLDAPGHEHEAPIDSRWAALGGLESLTEPAGHEAPHDVVNGADDSATTEEKR